MTDLFWGGRALSVDREYVALLRARAWVLSTPRARRIAGHPPAPSYGMAVGVDDSIVKER